MGCNAAVSCDEPDADPHQRDAYHAAQLQVRDGAPVFLGRRVEFHRQEFLALAERPHQQARRHPQVALGQRPGFRPGGADGQLLALAHQQEPALAPGHRQRRFHHRRQHVVGAERGLQRPRQLQHGPQFAQVRAACDLGGRGRFLRLGRGPQLLPARTPRGRSRETRTRSGPSCAASCAPRAARSRTRRSCCPDPPARAVRCPRRSARGGARPGCPAAPARCPGAGRCGTAIASSPRGFRSRMAFARSGKPGARRPPGSEAI